MFCPNCGIHISDNNPICPNCQADLSSYYLNIDSHLTVPQKRKKPYLAIFLICFLLIISILIALISTHVICIQHEFSLATCSTPATCKYCGKENGIPLSHIWENASCFSPKTCADCGISIGEPLEHSWIEATCTSPQKCAYCNVSLGKAKGHTYGEWTIKTEATVIDSGKMVRACSFCKETEDKSYELESFIQNQKFIFTPEEFRTMFFDNFDELGYSRFGGAQIRNKDGQVVVAVIDSGLNNVANIGFVSDSNSWEMATSKSDSGFEGLVMLVNKDAEFLANAMISFIMSCDPSVSLQEAKQIGASLVEEEKTAKNGIIYTIAQSSDLYMIIAVASN